MKYIAQSIKEQIRNNIPTDNEEMMLKITNFSTLEYYYEICKVINDYCNQNQITCKIKLANKKYEYFNENPSNKKMLDFMLQNDWVANNESITYYRNLHNYTLLVLLGTEDEDDKDGLLNCTEITPESIANKLSNDYSVLFNFISDISDNTKNRAVINKLYGDLFSYVPIDVCKLSKQADDWENDISNTSEFVQNFYASLPEWGLPARLSDIRSIDEITKSFKKKNILQIEYKFINRLYFSDLSSKKYDEIMEKCEEYGKSGKYAISDYSWDLNKVTNYDEYIEVLKSFINGDNINKDRETLLYCDISIAEDIMNLKVEHDPPTPKNRENAITGNPLTVFSEILLTNLSQFRNLAISKVVITINKVSLLIGISQLEVENITSDEAIHNSWKNLCCHINGVFDFINRKEWLVNDELVTLELSNDEDQQDFFNPLNFPEDKIDAASITKKNNSIILETNCYDKDGNKIEKTTLKYKWVFTNGEPWLNEFTPICNLNSAKLFNDYEPFIALSTLPNIHSLVASSSSDEFFDTLCSSDIELTSEMNILKNDFIKKLDDTDPSDTSYIAALLELGKSFKKFGSAINNDGYYRQLLSPNSEMYDFIKAYKNFGVKLTETDVPENRKWLFNVFINSFCIEKDMSAAIQDNECNSCIVPPWNPIALEKLNDQKLFIMDGCYEWWRDNNSSMTNINPMIKQMDFLEEMSIVKNSAVLFPISQQRYYGCINSFGSYSLYATPDFNKDGQIKDCIQKDSIFDDSFTKEELIGVSEDSKMILHILKSYIKSFTFAKFNLKLTFINPGELQPIISAVYNYIQFVRKDSPKDKINIELQILVKPENRGGKTYLSYWMNEFFSEDKYTNVKTFLTEYSTVSNIKNLVSPNNDIIFYKDFLTSNDFTFYVSNKHEYREESSCRFPIVYKPKLVSNTAGNKRAIEISQPQFGCEHIHTQSVYHSRNTIPTSTNNVIAAQEMKLEDNVYETICSLHALSNWVVCVDSGLDGALLRNKNASHSSDYSIIGFSTGNGNYGKYNYTITARQNMIAMIEESFKNRLSLLFNNWSQDIINRVVKRCLAEATNLDGISLLSAINLKDNNINEFMAYVLTSFREKKRNLDCPLRVLIHLDSYKHWFNNQVKENSDNSTSRADFLSLEINDFTGEKIIIDATVIECKISTLNNSVAHIKKAGGQVEHTLKRLTEIFNPDSDSILRRYWYAQLYRALTFAQVTFKNVDTEYDKLSEKLRLILDGNFEMRFNGEILGYWFDSNEDDIRDSHTDNNIVVHNIPQKVIQKMFIDDDSYDCHFIPNTDDALFRNVEEQQKFNELNYSNREDSIEEDDTKPIQQNDEDLLSFKKEADEEHLNEIEIDNNQKEEIKQTEEQELEKTQDSNGDIRVLIGESKYNSQNVYWEFGHKSLANRHLLITGTSGQGKTYCIQTLLYELSKSNVSTIIFDYTEGFTLEQLDPIFKEKIGDNFIQTVVYGSGVSINPFRRYDIEVAGQLMPEQDGAVACRIRDIFSHVYGFGEQQESAIYQAVRDGLNKYGDKMSMEHFVEELKSQNTGASKTVYSKILPFTDMVKFNTENPLDWKHMIYSPKPQVYVFQLTLYDRLTQVIITEMLLWNLWYYTTRYGTKDKPFAVVLDEAQNLSHKDSSPTCKILTEGRKFGWSAWFATQSLQVLNSDEITRLLQAATKIYFKPTDNEIKDISKQLNPQEPNKWIDSVKSLSKGQCIVVGDRCDANGNFKPTSPTITNVISLDKR